MFRAFLVLAFVIGFLASVVGLFQFLSGVPDLPTLLANETLSLPAADHVTVTSSTALNISSSRMVELNGVPEIYAARLDEPATKAWLASKAITADTSEIVILAKSPTKYMEIPIATVTTLFATGTFNSTLKTAAFIGVKGDILIVDLAENVISFKMPSRPCEMLPESIHLRDTRELQLIYRRSGGNYSPCRSLSFSGVGSKNQNSSGCVEKRQTGNTIMTTYGVKDNARYVLHFDSVWQVLDIKAFWGCDPPGCEEKCVSESEEEGPTIIQIPSTRLR